MAQRGTIRVWKDDKGFGFITPDGGGQDIFVHVSGISGSGRRPVVGDAVSYVLATASDGRVRAADVSIAGAAVTAKLNPVPLLLAAFCVGCGIFLMARTGLPLVLAYPIMSAITYAVYAHDKAEAQAGGFRVPENTLHLLEMLGGWCGGYIAQERLRHKTAKESYQAIFWVIVILHGLGWALWLYMSMAKSTS